MAGMNSDPASVRPTSRRRRLPLGAEADRRNRAQLARLGLDVRWARRRRRLTQAAVGARIGLHQTTISRLERGAGAGLSLHTWQRVALAVGRPLRLELAHDPLGEPVDAAHLALQELVLRLGRAAGYLGTFELPTRPADPRHSIDVCLRDDRRRRLLIVETWNTFGDLGAARRSFSRKIAETKALAVALGHGRPYRVHGCWIVRSTRRNRDLFGRYPEIFAAALPGSAVRWRVALTKGDEPPSEPGLLWCDVRASRIFARRRRPGCDGGERLTP